MNKKQFWQELKSGKFAKMVKESAPGQTARNALETYNILKPLCAAHPDVETGYFIFKGKTTGSGLES